MLGGSGACEATVTRPVTRYAKNGGVHIAYQVVGNGPFDLVFVSGYISNLDVQWEDPGFAHLLNRLAAFSRLIIFDKRGTGLSDPVAELPTLEQRMEDLRAVMDAVGSRKAALIGASEGGPMSILFAATWPERVHALVLYGSYAHFQSAVLGRKQIEAFINGIDAEWGSGASLRYFAPGLLGDPRYCEWWARFERLGASPDAAIKLARMNAEIDVRRALPTIGVPTLVIHRADDVRVKPAAGRFLAQQIPGAVHLEVPGRDHPIFVGDIDRVVDEIEEFLTGVRPVTEFDRTLATILAVDLPEPGRQARRFGDHRWCEALAGFRAAAAAEYARWRGSEVASGPASSLAAFDGPARAVRCAMSLLEAVAPLDLEIRTGIHTGEVETRDGVVGGHAVHVAQDVAARAEPGMMLATGVVRDLVAGSGLAFFDSGRSTPDGLPLLIVEVPGKRPTHPAADGQLNRLTPREWDILHLIACGLSNSAIAERLTLSEHTVKRHVANILTKLDLPSRAAAAALAARHAR